jgi:hypothetical protein
VDIESKVIAQLIEHWPFMVGFAWMARYGFPWGLKLYFSNGGGVMMRNLIKEELSIQSATQKEEMTRIVQVAIHDHERVEESLYEKRHIRK